MRFMKSMMVKVNDPDSVYQYSDPETFKQALASAMEFYPVTFDNGNTIVFQLDNAELTMVRQEMTEIIRLTCICNPEVPGDCRSYGCDPECPIC